jgi:hypothetical protein
MTARLTPPDTSDLSRAVAALEEIMARVQGGKFDPLVGREVIIRMRGLAEAVRRFSDDVDQSVLLAERMYFEIYGGEGP